MAHFIVIIIACGTFRAKKAGNNLSDCVGERIEIHLAGLKERRVHVGEITFFLKYCSRGVVNVNL